VRVRRPEFWRAKQSLQHLPNVTVFLQESLCHAVNQSRWRSVRNEAYCQFCGNEPGCCRMARQNVKNFATLFFPARLDAMAKHLLVSGLMHPFFESKAAALFGLLQRPPRED